MSTEEAVSIICGDTEVDNEESDCCSEDLISEEVISASASKRLKKLDPAVPTLSKRAIILLSVLHRALCPVETPPLFTLHPVNIFYLVRVMTAIHLWSNYYVTKPPILLHLSGKMVNVVGVWFLEGIVF